MISHEYEPPTPTKKEELEGLISQTKYDLAANQNALIELTDETECLKLELEELEEQLRRLEPDPDYGREE